MIIIPDVHGRSFWKNYVKGKTNQEIIFLGDYLDPYQHEEITGLEAVKNFKNIIKFKKQHMDNVTLLLGNHDMCYINGNMSKCRYLYSYEDELKALFRDNIDLFKLAVIKNINGKTVLFSHSCLCKRWIDNVNYRLNTNHNAKTLIPFIENAIKNNDTDVLINTLEIVGRSRGGWSDAGSITWADVSEIYYDSNYVHEINVQIFGHSQQHQLPIIEDGKFACLDVREGFTLTDDGTLIQRKLKVKNKLI